MSYSVVREGCRESAVPTTNVEPEVLVDADLDTLAAALYVRTDDLLNDSPQRIPWRPPR